MNKKKAIKVHARKRFKERFGVELTQKVHDDILHLIHKGLAKFIENQSTRISVFELTVNDVGMRVVYDKTRKCVITAIPLRGNKMKPGTANGE